MASYCEVALPGDSRRDFQNIKRILERVSIACYAERCINYDRFRLSVLPSVCLSVTVWYHVKTTTFWLRGCQWKIPPVLLRTFGQYLRIHKNMPFWDHKTKMPILSADQSPGRDVVLRFGGYLWCSGLLRFAHRNATQSVERGIPPPSTPLISALRPPNLQLALTPLWDGHY